MSLKVKRKAVSNIPPLPGGTYMGVCIAVVDLGEQYDQYNKQKQGKYVDQCMFIFEIPAERVDVDGESKPRWISSKRMSQSLNEKSNLYALLESWRGVPLGDANEFDLPEMLGRPAMLTITLKERKDGTPCNQLTTVTGLPKGIPAPQPESELICFDADEPDAEALSKLPEWVQDIIAKSTQFAHNPPSENIEFSSDQAAASEEGVCPI